MGDYLKNPETETVPSPPPEETAEHPIDNANILLQESQDDIKEATKIRDPLARQQRVWEASAKAAKVVPLLAYGLELERRSRENMLSLGRMGVDLQPFSVAPDMRPEWQQASKFFYHFYVPQWLSGGGDEETMRSMLREISYEAEQARKVGDSSKIARFLNARDPLFRRLAETFESAYSEHKAKVVDNLAQKYEQTLGSLPPEERARQLDAYRQQVAQLIDKDQDYESGYSKIRRRLIDLAWNKAENGGKEWLRRLQRIPFYDAAWHIANLANSKRQEDQDALRLLRETVPQADLIYRGYEDGISLKNTTEWAERALKLPPQDRPFYYAGLALHKELLGPVEDKAEALRRSFQRLFSTFTDDLPHLIYGNAWLFTAGVTGDVESLQDAERFLKHASERYKAHMESFAHGAIKGDFVDNLIVTYTNMFPMLAATAAGHPYLSLAMCAAAEGLPVYHDLLQAKVPPGAALLGGLAAGLVNAYFEQGVIEKILGRTIPLGAGKILGPQSRKALIDKLAGTIVNTTSRWMGESLEEGVQGIVSELSIEMTKWLAQNGYPPQIVEAMGRGLKDFFQAIPVMFPITILGVCSDYTSAAADLQKLPAAQIAVTVRDKIVSAKDIARRWEDHYQQLIETGVPREIALQGLPPSTPESIYRVKYEPSSKGQEERLTERFAEKQVEARKEYEQRVKASPEWPLFKELMAENLRKPVEAKVAPEKATPQLVAQVEQQRQELARQLEEAQKRAEELRRRSEEIAGQKTSSTEEELRIRKKISLLGMERAVLLAKADRGARDLAVLDEWLSKARQVVPQQAPEQAEQVEQQPPEPAPAPATKPPTAPTPAPAETPAPVVQPSSQPAPTLSQPISQQPEQSVAKEPAHIVVVADNNEQSRLAVVQNGRIVWSSEPIQQWYRTDKINPAIVQEAKKLVDFIQNQLKQPLPPELSKPESPGFPVRAARYLSQLKQYAREGENVKPYDPRFFEIKPEIVPGRSPLARQVLYYRGKRIIASEPYRTDKVDKAHLRAKKALRNFINARLEQAPSSSAEQPTAPPPQPEAPQPQVAQPTIPPSQPQVVQPAAPPPQPQAAPAQGEATAAPVAQPQPTQEVPAPPAPAPAPPQPEAPKEPAPPASPQAPGAPSQAPAEAPVDLSSLLPPEPPKIGANNQALLELVGIPPIPERIEPLATGKAAPIVVPETGAGNKTTNVTARYVLVELGQLIASHKPHGDGGGMRDERYPFHLGLQMRDYTQPEAMQYIHSIALSLNPALYLSESVTADQGPPVIARNGVVLQGNGRVLALKLLEEYKTYDIYKNQLIAQLQRFGIDPQEVFPKIMSPQSRPILVRMIDAREDDPISIRIGRMANISLTQQLDDKGLVASVATALMPVIQKLGNLLQENPDKTMGEILNSPMARDLREALGQALPAQRGYLLQSQPGSPLTEHGRIVMREALLYSAFEDLDFIRQIERRSPMVADAVEGCVPALLAIKAASVPTVRYPHAVDLITPLKMALLDFIDWLENPDAYGVQSFLPGMGRLSTPASQLFFEAFRGTRLAPDKAFFNYETKRVSPVKMRAMFQRLARDVTQYRGNYLIEETTPFPVVVAESLGFPSDVAAKLAKDVNFDVQLSKEPPSKQALGIVPFTLFSSKLEPAQQVDEIHELFREAEAAWRSIIESEQDVNTIRERLRDVRDRILREPFLARMLRKSEELGVEDLQKLSPEQRRLLDEAEQLQNQLHDALREQEMLHTAAIETAQRRVGLPPGTQPVTVHRDPPEWIAERLAQSPWLRRLAATLLRIKPVLEYVPKKIFGYTAEHPAIQTVVNILARGLTPRLMYRMMALEKACRAAEAIMGPRMAQIFDKWDQTRDVETLPEDVRPICRILQNLGAITLDEAFAQGCIPLSDWVFMRDRYVPHVYKEQLKKPAYRAEFAARLMKRLSSTWRRQKGTMVEIEEKKGLTGIHNIAYNFASALTRETVDLWIQSIWRFIEQFGLPPREAPKDWVPLPGKAGPAYKRRYGRAGTLVYPREIVDAVSELIRMALPQTDEYAAFWRRMVAWVKRNLVVYSPKSQITQFMSNALEMLSNGGCSLIFPHNWPFIRKIYDYFRLVRDENADVDPLVREYRQTSYHALGRGTSLFTMFYEQLRDGIPPELLPETLRDEPSRFEAILQKVSQFPSEVWQAVDAGFKCAIYCKRRHMGDSPAQANAYITRFCQDYLLGVSPRIKRLETYYCIGSFLAWAAEKTRTTWNMLWTPAGAIRLAGRLAMLASIRAAALATLGPGATEEWKRIQKIYRMPWTVVPLPWRDSRGRIIPIDVGAFYPSLQELSWLLPLVRGSFGEALNGLATMLRNDWASGHPLIRPLVEAVFGREVETGRELYVPSEPLQKKLLAAFIHILLRTGPAIITMPIEAQRRKDMGPYRWARLAGVPVWTPRGYGPTMQFWRRLKRRERTVERQRQREGYR